MPLTVLRLRFAKRAIGIAVQNNLVEVEAHPPNRVVSKPVAAADGAFRISKNRLADTTGHAMNPRPHQGNAMRETTNYGGYSTLGAVLQVGTGMLVSTLRGTAFGVVREPILVCVHPD